MESEPHRDTLDENVRRLLEAARQEDGGFRTRLRDVVREEVRKERSSIRRARVFRLLSAATGVAAVLAIGWFFLGFRTGQVGQFQALYGAAEVVDGNMSRRLADGEPVRAGCSIRTLSGSKAAVVLRDGSRLTLAPRTVVQVAGRWRNSVARLETGKVDVEAAKQHGGRRLVIETPGSRITTLGTVFSVQSGTKPDGIRETRVDVTSGLVEFESGGQKVQLPARTEGIAEEGQSPRKRLASFELNELVRLIRRTDEVAASLNKRAGSPAIIQCKDGSTAAIWTVIGVEDLRDAGEGQRSLRLKSSATKARLFTSDGREISAKAQGRDLRVDASAPDGRASQDRRLILELQGVRGFFQTDEGGTTRLRLPSGTSDVVSLLQFHLPGGAKIERISPEPMATVRILNRLAVTVAAEIKGLEVFE
jgi:ferric-dicitrate binding protein FerR (iron transport regulator)